MTNEQVPYTQIAGLIASKMSEQGISIKDMAAKLEITYEHVRRVVRGEGVPSKHVLKPLCDVLKISYKEAEKLATADRIRKKYGTVTLEMQGRMPSLEPLENVWGKLTPDQQSALIDLANSFVKRNRLVKPS